jgi:hypothetical protein
VLFESMPGIDALMMFTGPSRPDVWKQPEIMDEIERHLSSGRPIVVREGNGERWHALVPEGIDPKSVIESVIERVRERRERHGGTDIRD